MIGQFLLEGDEGRSTLDPSVFDEIEEEDEEDEGQVTEPRTQNAAFPILTQVVEAHACDPKTANRRSFKSTNRELGMTCPRHLETRRRQRGQHRSKPNLQKSQPR